jgi:hypothetical protein
MGSGFSIPERVILVSGAVSGIDQLELCRNESRNISQLGTLPEKTR